MLYDKHMVYSYKHTLPLHDADDFCESTAEQQSNFKKLTHGKHLPRDCSYISKDQFLYKAFQTKKLELVLKRNQKKDPLPSTPQKVSKRSILP